jgi:hypothetical protein
MIVPSPPRHRLPSVTESIVLPPDPKGEHHALANRQPAETKRFTMVELYELRRVNHQALALDSARAGP